MSDQFTLAFDGRPHEIDAVTLGHSLLDVARLVQATTHEINSDLKADVKVIAHEPGSFEVLFNLDLLASAPDGLWAEAIRSVIESSTLTKTIVESLVAALLLFRTLKGGPPAEVTALPPPAKGEPGIGEPGAGAAPPEAASAPPITSPAPTQSIQITSADNSTIIINQQVLNIYNSEPFQRTAPHFFETLDANDAVEGVRIVEGPTDAQPDRQRRTLLEVSRADFAPLSAPPAPVLVGDAALPTADSRVVRRSGLLQVLRIHFQPGHQWSFLYEGFDVSGAIEDESFWRRVERRDIVFANGDTLDATFEFTQRRDPARRVYVTDKRSFKIVEVRRVIPPSAQMLLPE